MTNNNQRSALHPNAGADRISQQQLWTTSRTRPHWLIFLFLNVNGLCKSGMRHWSGYWSTWAESYPKKPGFTKYPEDDCSPAGLLRLPEVNYTLQQRHKDVYWVKSSWLLSLEVDTSRLAHIRNIKMMDRLFSTGCREH